MLEPLTLESRLFRFAPDTGALGTGLSVTRPAPLLSQLTEIISQSYEGPVLLGAKSALGESLWLRSQFGAWDLHPGKSLLLIDIFAGEESSLKPVAHYDWEIQEAYALGNKNRHGGLESKLECDRVSSGKWSANAFEVIHMDFLKFAEATGNPVQGMVSLRSKGFINSDEDWGRQVYQQRGLGSFLVVAVALELDRRGVTSMDLGSRSELAMKCLSKFELQEKLTTPQAIISHPYSLDAVARIIGVQDRSE